MWTEPFWVALAVVTAAVLVALGLAVLIGIAVQRVADRRRRRQRMAAARRGQVSVYDIQRRIDEANRQVTRQLSMDTAVRRAREEDAALAKADTVTLAGDEPAPLPLPEETTIAFAAPVPAQRPAIRARPYLDARAAAGRAGTR